VNATVNLEQYRYFTNEFCNYGYIYSYDLKIEVDARSLLQKDMKKLITIRLRSSTLEPLRSIGNENESVKSIINQLLKKWKEDSCIH